MAWWVARMAAGGGGKSVSMFSRRRMSGSWAASAALPMRSTPMGGTCWRRVTGMGPGYFMDEPALRANSRNSPSNLRPNVAQREVGIGHPAMVFLLAVERVFLDPVKAARNQQELLTVKELKLHMNFVIVHVAVECQSVGRRALKDKVGFPVLVVSF